MKSAVICFIGTDGAGKSTLLSEAKKELEKNQSLKVPTVYFGWKPFLPTTKLISNLFKKKNYQITTQMNKKEQKFSLLQEAMLGYYFIEYLSRYIFQIKLPLLKNFSKKQKQVMLVDRYFYDLYAHYQYAEKSFIFPTLLRIMPKPDLIIFLDVNTETAKKRKPEMDPELLKEHCQRYQKLSKLIEAKIVKTDQELEPSVNEVLRAIQEKVTKKQ